MQPFSLDAELMLKGDVTFKCDHVLFFCEHEEIATLAIFNILSELIFESIQHPEAGEREFDVYFSSELISDTAGASPRGTLAQALLFLEQDDILYAESREMIGCAGPHNTAAHDDNLGSGVKLH